VERIRLAERTAFRDDRMARHRLASTARLHTDLYCLRPGQSQAAHVHDAQDKLYVGIDGRALIHVGSEVDWLEPGVLVLVPAGVEHGLENPTEGPFVALAIVVPPPAHA
jgi:mannose-6-phosphate isomerase-like protein (cupin superfamily)